jgi:D-sedoheptulose 7-phosphate isomerase
MTKSSSASKYRRPPRPRIAAAGVEATGTPDPSTNLVSAKLLEGLAVMQAVAHDAALHATLVAAAHATADALLAGRKLMVAGNGGSAADAQHIAAEFVCRLVDDRPAMRAVALTANTSILTAVSNDYGFERVFARQVEALGQPGDVFLAISTSGNSPNILRALEQCRTMGIVTIGLTGKTGGKMAGSKMPPLCDYSLRMPSDVTMYIQQAHLALEHIFSLLVERRCFHGQSG